MGASHLPSKSLHDNSAGKTRIWFVDLKPINFFVIKNHYNFLVQNIISSSWFKLFRCWIEFWKSQREHQTYDNISLGSAKLWRFRTQRLFFKACYILILIKFLLFCSEKASHISNFMRIIWCKVFNQEFNPQRPRFGPNQRWFGNRHMMILSIRIWLVNFHFFPLVFPFNIKFHSWEPKHG